MFSWFRGRIGGLLLRVRRPRLALEVVRRMPKQAAAWKWIVPVFLSVTALSPPSALAEGGRIRVSTELDYTATNADIQNKRTGVESETDRSYFLQLYTLELEKEIFPYLDFRTGGLLRLIDSTQDTTSSDPDREATTDFEERLGRAFAELNLNNPLYTGGVAYHWTELKEGQTTDGVDDFSTRLFREEYDGRFKWSPEGFPSFDLEFNRFHLYDDANERDRLDDRLSLETRYGYKGFLSDYTYTRLDSEQKIADSGALTQIHDGGATYSDSFFGNRVSMIGGFRLRHSTIEPSGTGDYDLPVTSPGIPFSVPDDSINPEFTDVGDFASLTAGRIGVDSPENQTEVSFGLNFDFPTDVHGVYVVPTRYSPEIRSLTWTVFVSDDEDESDGVDWTLHEDGIITSYSVANDRFEIRFSLPAENIRRVKVLTTSKFVASGEEIGVDQIEAFIVIPGGAGLKIKNFVQNYNLGLRWAITDRTTTAYDGFYRSEEDEPFDLSRTTLTNSIRIQHIFGPILVGSARVMRTDGSSSDEGDMVGHLYSASLRANYLDTLGQTLVYSGRQEKDEQGSGRTDSILLRTNADLYRNWSMNLDVGYTWRKPIEGENGTTALLRLGTDVAPNEKLRFVMNYLARWRTEDGGSPELDHNASFQAFWVPFRTLSLFGRVNLRRRESDGEGLTVSQNYSVNWAPFPDGSLHFSFAYNEILDTRERQSRIFSPQVDWQVTHNALLTVRFNIGTIESQTEKSDVRNLRAELKFFY